jgi:hypothetical protein
MPESIDEDLVIKDIDSPLYKYFYFYTILFLVLRPEF